MENKFIFSDNCYFDMRTNRLVYAENDPVVIKGQKRSVLRQLIEAFPLAVSTTVLGEEAGCCDEERLRKVIMQLREYPEVKPWIKNDWCGYILIQPDDMKEDVFQERTCPNRTPQEEDRHIFIPQGGPCTLQNRTPAVSPYFVEEARADTFKELDEAFRDRNVVFLWGDGGIGKSEAAKKWAINRKHGTIVFAQLNFDSSKGNIQSLITDDSIFVLTEGFPARFEGEPKDAYFTRKLNKIKQVTDEKTLIIIDNYDRPDDLMNELLGGPYHLLVTTRNDPKDYGFPVIRVNEIQNIEHLTEIFFRYLDGERDDISRDDPYIEKLFTLVANHTLAIELIAKVLRFSNNTPQTLYANMNNSQNHELLGNVVETVDKKTPFEIIKLLFNISSIVNDEDKDSISQLLTFMAVMPTKGIELSLLQKWSTRELKEARRKLVKRSWLRQDEVNGKQSVSMHPLIREVVWNDLKPSLDAFPTIIDAFINDDKKYINRLYHEPKETKKHYEEVVLSLLHAFPVCGLEHIGFYSKILRTLRLCANVDVALALAEDIAKYYETEEQKESWEYGFVQYQIGAVYAHLLRQPNKGIPSFEKAIDIMEGSSDTKEKKLWLALLYRDIASVKCQDKYLLGCQDSQELDAIESYLTNGEILAKELLANGSTIDNLKIYHGTLCVWRSKIAVQRSKFDIASQLLDEAEENFKNLGYSNAVDKAAIADIRALISRKNVDDKGCEEEIRHLTEASKAFLDGFTEYHYASIERLLKLANAYINNGNLKEAQSVLLHCKELLEEMKQNSEETSHQAFFTETTALLKELGGTLQD